MSLQETLFNLVSINSVFPNEEEISSYLTDYFKNLGYKVEKVKTEKKRFNLIATNGLAGHFLGFYGHMDTVPPDEKVLADPFKMRLAGDKITGLGTEDMKGAIACFMLLAIDAKRDNLPVKFIFGVDEENISRGAHDLVDSGKLRDLDFLVVGESGQIKDRYQPYNVCYGRKGRVVFEVKIFGKKVHAAENSKGVNAINKAAEFINAVSKVDFEGHKDLGKCEIVFEYIESGATSFSTPHECTLRLSVLTVPGVSSKNVVEKLSARGRGLGLDFKIAEFSRITPYGESYGVDTGNKFLKKLEGEMFNKDGVVPIYTASVADENVFANRLKIPVISLGPIGGGGHTKEEWVSLESLKSTSLAYRKVLELYNGL